ncbi:MAG: pyrroline-5-carboxylate reductase [Methyloligella sp. ZOD6]
MSLDLSRPVLLVGAGKMGGAMLSGWLDAGLSPNLIHVQDPNPSPEMAARLEGLGIRPVAEADRSLDPAIVVLAVKPQTIDAVLPGLAPLVGEGTVVVSIAAGKTLAGLEAKLPSDAAVIRAMPNTPAAIGQGVIVACANDTVTSEQRQHCDLLLQAGGTVLWLEEETGMDAVTALSGSGPAYVFLLTECMAQAGVSLGLAPELAAELARETVAGAGALMQESALPPGQLRENVTSPQGVTAAALDVLMADDGLEALMRRAMAKAAKRSEELST